MKKGEREKGEKEKREKREEEGVGEKQEKRVREFVWYENGTGKVDSCSSHIYLTDLISY